MNNCADDFNSLLLDLTVITDFNCVDLFSGCWSNICRFDNSNRAYNHNSEMIIPISVDF